MCNCPYCRIEEEVCVNCGRTREAHIDIPERDDPYKVLYAGKVTVYCPDGSHRTFRRFKVLKR